MSRLNRRQAKTQRDHGLIQVIVGFWIQGQVCPIGPARRYYTGAP
jgi:hypothetical protein